MTSERIARQGSKRGFSLIELLPAIALIALVAMAAVAWVTRSAQHADWTRDKVFARQKAISILAELRSYVEGGEGEVAADLDGFDDGLVPNPSLTIQEDPDDPGAFLPPGHPVSGNNMDLDVWNWYRRIVVRPFPGVQARDLRICTVRMFRMRPGDTAPGEQMAEVSTVIRTIGDAFPTTQVYDVYLLAIENVPGWWVYMDAIQPFVEATFTDLESRNPGLEFRTHWITKLGFGRDEEYAPYTNEGRDSQARTPWTYVYPGRMPTGEAAQRYYVAERMQARVNLDGEDIPIHVNDLAAGESFTDTNGNGRRDAGEPFVDADSDGQWDVGNSVPYALADMHNHCMRWPEAAARFDARVAAGLETDDTPSWRLLLDRMIQEPDRYHNAILINLHGELLPMPPVRNFSDAAKIPETRPGWRAVTHPERLRPRRTAGNDALSDAPRFRVYAYKSSLHDAEPVMTQREPFVDANGSGTWETGETFQDWNANGVWDAGIAISVLVRDGDFSGAPNDATSPSIRIRRLPGGVDGDGNGTAEPYADWQDAPRFPESFTDGNADGRRQIAETYLDLDGNGTKDPSEPHQELDGDGVHTLATEALVDVNGNGRFDLAQPAEPFTDANGNGRWDAAEPYWDWDNDGAWTAPVAPVLPWQPWNTANYGDPTATAAYVSAYGEPFVDIDGDSTWDAAEPLFDANANGVQDGGFDRGEMWFEIRHVTGRGTVLALHGTPLETPYLNDGANAQKGLPSSARLYDLDYVPCPTPATATAADRFGRDLFTSSSGDPKNTARWTIELPLAAVRTAFVTGDTTDRIVGIETRLGTDLDTGVLWPTRNDPANLSTTYAYFYADADDVPYSERYQFVGDPRHSPYADTDRTGSTAANGYNWYFDDFQDGTYNAQGRWLAFDSARLRDAWLGRCCHDLGRLMGWLREAVTSTEAVYTTLTGFSYYYLSLGGDVGYDSANGFPNSIPMDGLPFGLTGDVFENTITGGGGTGAIVGSLKHVRSNNGTATGIRAGGYWWSKPWIGELCPDDAYASQWRAWGNLRAATGSGAGTYRLVRRGDVTGAQQPQGTTLLNRYARLAAEGCTSLFNVGTSSSTFHHQYRNGQTGGLVEDGPQLAQQYNFPLPTRTLISRPFGLSTGGAGGVGDEFAFSDSYPRYGASMVRRFYDHQSGQTGSALVRLDEPGAARSGFIVVNGIDRTIESGSAFIARYSGLSLIHSYFAAGAPGEPNRIRQLPRVQIRTPTLVTELDNPSTVDVRWSIEWKRWDGQVYTSAYPTTHAEDETDLLYVPMYSVDNGRTWRDMLRDEVVEPGRIPWLAGTGPDPARTLVDQVPGGDESLLWSTPAASYPEGSYLVRVEAYRASESLHYSQHVEKIYVNR